MVQKFSNITPFTCYLLYIFLTVCVTPKSTPASLVVISPLTSMYASLQSHNTDFVVVVLNLIWNFISPKCLFYTQVLILLCFLTHLLCFEISLYLHIHIDFVHYFSGDIYHFFIFTSSSVGETSSISPTLLQKDSKNLLKVVLEVLYPYLLSIKSQFYFCCSLSYLFTISFEYICKIC